MIWSPASSRLRPVSVTTVPAAIAPGVVYVTVPSPDRNPPLANQPLSVKLTTVPASTSRRNTNVNASVVVVLYWTMAISPGSRLVAMAQSPRPAGTFFLGPGRGRQPLVRRTWPRTAGSATNCVYCSRRRKNRSMARLDSRKQRAESREQRAESREQRAESREQRAESREQRAESRE